MKILYLFSVIVLLTACSNPQKGYAQLSYDIQIDYLSTPINDDRKIPNDSIYVVFDGNFNKDTIDIAVNGSHLNTMLLTTDERDGLAGVVKTIPYQNVKTIGIRINHGKLIFIETEKKHYNIVLTYIENRAEIRFYRKLPGYM